MSELERRVHEARDLLEVDVARAQTARAWVQFEARQRRARRRRTAAAGVGGLAVAAAILLLVSDGGSEPEPQIVEIVEQAERIEPLPVPAPPPASPRFTSDAANPTRTVVFSDGSLARLLEANTALRMETEAEELLELMLDRGVARFTVEKDATRLFRVRTPDLRVEVLGTRFTVSSDPEAHRTEVTVDRGRVAVIRGEDRHELGPGMRLTFDGSQTVIVDERAPKKPKVKRRKARRRRRRPEPTASAPAWQDLAADGRYSDAYQAMSEAPRPRSARELMLAADVARLSGHPEEAIAHLQVVMRAHRDKPQGLLAAFTLGRILQRELGKPREAAAAFHTARTLAPSGSLAEDALAHEAECRARAGQREAAAALAAEYLRQYAKGRKAGTMRRLVDTAP